MRQQQKKERRKRRFIDNRMIYVEAIEGRNDGDTEGTTRPKHACDIIRLSRARIWRSKQTFSVNLRKTRKVCQGKQIKRQRSNRAAYG